MKGWKDISLGKAIELMNIPTTGDAIDIIINQMAIIYDKTPYEIELMTPNQLIEFSNGMDWMSVMPKSKLTKVIKVNGREYGITNFNEICLAQMIDIEEYYSMGLNDTIHKILSVLYLPIKSRIPLTDRYKLEEYEPSEERENDMLDVDMETMWGTILFFYRGVKTYSVVTKDYLEQERTKSMIELEVMRLKKIIGGEQ
jgi:hypothetical protein